jgi:hypothetical protein
VDAITQLNQWRIRSAHLIISLGIHDSNQALEMLAKHMTDVLTRLFSATPSPATGELAQDLRNIINKAAEIDTNLRTSKAYFRVYMNLPLDGTGSGRPIFDAQTMDLIRHLSPEVDEEDRPMAVDLVVSPGLTKTGNSDGNNYDTSFVLIKPEVVCNLYSSTGEISEINLCNIKETKSLPEDKHEEKREGRQASTI